MIKESKGSNVDCPSYVTVKKAPIWNYFKVLESDISKASCHLCGGNYSLGSDKPRFQTTSSIKKHLKCKHQEEFTKFLEESKERTEKRTNKKEGKGTPIIASNKAKKEQFSNQQNLIDVKQNVDFWGFQSENSQNVSDNPWQVESIDAFYYLKCPECSFDTKDQDFFEIHAAENHPLSFTFFGNHYKEPEFDENDFIKNEPLSDNIVIKKEPNIESHESGYDFDGVSSPNDQFPLLFEDPLNTSDGISVHEDKKFSTVYMDENQGSTKKKLSSKTTKKGPIWNYFNVLESDKSRAKCNICGDNYSLGSDIPKFQTTSSVKKHLKSKHEDYFLKFLKESEERHERKLKEKDSSVVYYCSVCNAKFSKKFHLNHHIETVHDSKKYNCPICNDGFSKKGMLRKHLESVHEGQKPFQCSLCDAGFSFNPHLKRHFSSVHGGKKHDCTICAKSFSQIVNLKRHISSVHEGKKRYMCYTCGHGFYDKKDLQKHISCVHEGAKPLKCPNCDQCFALQVLEITTNNFMKYFVMRDFEIRSVSPKSCYCQSVHQMFAITI